MENQYISAFKIVGTSVKSFNIKNEFVSFPNAKNLKRSIDVSHKIVSVENVNEQYLSGVLQLNIDVLVQDENRKYLLDLTIEGGFIAPLEIGEETFREMLVLNGITSLYSIARGFVQSTTSQTLTEGSILLPMFNVTAYSNDLNSQNDE